MSSYFKVFINFAFKSPSLTHSENLLLMKLFKKLLLVSLLIAACAGVADAQFRFGIKAGLNINSLHIKDWRQNLDKDNGTGWTAGVMGEFKVPLIGLCFDASVMYTRMNADITIFQATQAPMEESYLGEIKNHNFIQIPINIKYKFGLPVIGKFLSPYIYTGPDFSFKLDKNTLKDFKTKTCQVAWNVGLGLELVSHLQLQASYGFGINNIAKNWVTIPDEKINNNYWTVTAAYLF